MNQELTIPWSIVSLSLFFKIDDKPDMKMIPSFEFFYGIRDAFLSRTVASHIFLPSFYSLTLELQGKTHGRNRECYFAVSQIIKTFVKKGGNSCLKQIDV